MENLGQCSLLIGRMMNVSGGRLLLFVTQLTDGPNITFSILYVALNNYLYYISAYLIICVSCPAGASTYPAHGVGWRTVGGLKQCYIM